MMKQKCLFDCVKTFPFMSDPNEREKELKELQKLVENEKKKGRYKTLVINAKEIFYYIKIFSEPSLPDDIDFLSFSYDPEENKIYILTRSKEFDKVKNKDEIPIEEIKLNDFKDISKELKNFMEKVMKFIE